MTLVEILSLDTLPPIETNRQPGTQTSFSVCFMFCTFRRIRGGIYERYKSPKVLICVVPSTSLCWQVFPRYVKTVSSSKGVKLFVAVNQNTAKKCYSRILWADCREPISTNRTRVYPIYQQCNELNVCWFAGCVHKSSALYTCSSQAIIDTNIKRFKPLIESLQLDNEWAIQRIRLLCKFSTYLDYLDRPFSQASIF